MTFTFAAGRHATPDVIATWSREAVGTTLGAQGVGAFASAIWPLSNKALYIPFRLPTPRTLYKLGLFNGTVASGNADIGIYDETGTLLISSGSTAHAGTSVSQIFDVTDTPLGVGRYYLAAVLDNTSATVARVNPAAAGIRIMGIREQTSAFPLPGTATFAAPSSAFIPGIAAWFRTLV